MNVVTELLKSSLKLKPKIISLAECPLENGDCMKIKGFTCYASTRAEKYGCATYVKNEYVKMFVIDCITLHFVTLHTAGIEITIRYSRPRAKGLVFVTGRGGAGFHFVTPPLLWPRVNSLPFLPARYDTGPWPGCGAWRVFRLSH